MARQYHTSRVIVWVRPGELASTKTDLKAMPNVQITRSDWYGKLVVVLQTKRHGEIAEHLRAIDALPGVLNVTADLPRRRKRKRISRRAGDVGDCARSN